MLKVRRVLSVLCLFVFLGLPLAAQTERETVSPVARFLEAVWERLSAPLAPITSIWQADEGGAEIPDPGPLPGAGGGWDPLG
ncbi:MAG TPA: hypothetical protein VNM67_21320 [Thermoanaerobaculia bacterium]|jgi:hypothetical protein|nr:hypothetical protein [Thermoanaerobaculia bacterium]